MSSTDRRAARARLFAAVLLSGAALTACSTPVGPVGAASPLTPTEQYTVQVQQTPDQLALAPHAEGLSAAQADAIRAFAARWRESGRADVSIRTPADGEPQAVDRTAAELAEALQAAGVPVQQLLIGPYDAGAPGGPVLASFQRYEAIAPNCEQGWDNLTSTGANRPTAHFGCANTANFAAMIADPRDLISPAPGMAGDAARRQTVLGKYRLGEITSSARDEQAVGAISNAVK